MLSTWVSMIFLLCTFPHRWFLCTGNSMSTNVYRVDDDNEMIYPFRVSSTLIPDRHVDLLLFEPDGVHHYTTIRNFSRLVGRHHGHTTHCCRRCLHAFSSQEFFWMLMLSTVAMCKGPNFPRTRGVDSPISRNNC